MVFFASDEKLKKKNTKKTESQGKPVNASKFKPPILDESEIDLEDGKPDLKVPRFEIKLGRN